MELIAKKNKALKQVSESGNVVYALRITTYNPESWVEVDIVDVRNATDFEFSYCPSLENITCVEELPKCAISFSSSNKLTLDSVTNIITHLPDLSAEDSKTLTLHATTKTLLTEALIAEATNKNWIIA